MYSDEFNVFMGILGHGHLYSQVKNFIDLFLLY